jgi:hypothetical protein
LSHRTVRGADLFAAQKRDYEGLFCLCQIATKFLFLPDDNS